MGIWVFYNGGEPRHISQFGRRRHPSAGPTIDTNDSRVNPNVATMTVVDTAAVTMAIARITAARPAHDDGSILDGSKT